MGDRKKQEAGSPCPQKTIKELRDEAVAYLRQRTDIRKARQAQRQASSHDRSAGLPINSLPPARMLTYGNMGEYQESAPAPPMEATFGRWLGGGLPINQAVGSIWSGHTPGVSQYDNTTLPYVGWRQLGTGLAGIWHRSDDSTSGVQSGNLGGADHHPQGHFPQLAPPFLLPSVPSVPSLPSGNCTSGVQPRNFGLADNFPSQGGLSQNQLPFRNPSAPSSNSLVQPGTFGVAANSQPQGGLPQFLHNQPPLHNSSTPFGNGLSGIQFSNLGMVNGHPQRRLPQFPGAQAPLHNASTPFGNDQRGIQSGGMASNHPRRVPQSAGNQAPIHNPSTPFGNGLSGTQSSNLGMAYGHPQGRVPQFPGGQQPLHNSSTPYGNGLSDMQSGGMASGHPQGRIPQFAGTQQQFHHPPTGGASNFTNPLAHIPVLQERATSFIDPSLSPGLSSKPLPYAIGLPYKCLNHPVEFTSYVPSHQILILLLSSKNRAPKILLLNHTSDKYFTLPGGFFKPTQSQKSDAEVSKIESCNCGVLGITETTGISISWEVCDMQPIAVTEQYFADSHVWTYCFFVQERENLTVPVARGVAVKRGRENQKEGFGHGFGFLEGEEEEEEPVNAFCPGYSTGTSRSKREGTTCAQWVDMWRLKELMGGGAVLVSPLAKLERERDLFFVEVFLARCS